MVTIRLAREKDIPVLFDLVKGLADFTGYSKDFTATLEDWQRDNKEEVFAAHIALDGDKAVGCALHYPIYSTFKGKLLYLEDFFVLESHRRQGLGTLLFAAYKQYAMTTNCVGLKWQVLRDNKDAHAFYKSYNAHFEEEYWNGKVLF